MKTRKTKQNFKLSHIIVMMVLVFTGIISCTGQKTNSEVMDAYELRLNGHADSAQVLLLAITERNPANALAWFELCRCTEHMSLADPRSMDESIKACLKYIDKAIEIEEGNAKYLSYKGKIQTLEFYKTIMMGGEAGDKLAKIEETCQKVAEIDASYYENTITLVEFFAGLPEEMGGDIEKAEKYAQALEKADLIAGAKAREILMPEEADYEAFWKGIIEKAPQNADANQSLGRVYLFMGDIDQAKIEFQKAIDLEASKKELYLDLGRYYLMMTMQGQMSLDSATPLVEIEFNKYLDLKPAPIKPMQSWSMGQLAMLYRRSGNAEKAEEILNKANELDPFYSKAFGKPYSGLFTSPEEDFHFQNYYLSPF